MPVTDARRTWLAENTERVTVKLNHRTDADILDALKGKPRQTEIKRLIRAGMQAEDIAAPKGAGRSTT